MIFTIFWADSGLPYYAHYGMAKDIKRRYLTLDKHGNKYVVELFNRETWETISREEYKNYESAYIDFCALAFKYNMGKIHKEDLTETYDYIESQHD